MIPKDQYENIWKQLVISYRDITNFQLCSTDLSMIPLLLYFQKKTHDHIEEINVFFIRKNRLKGNGSTKIEGKIINKPILLIEKFIHSIDQYYYVKSCLEIIGYKKIEVFSPMVNENVLLMNIFDREGIYNQLQFLGNEKKELHNNWFIMPSPIIYEELIIIMKNAGDFVARCLHDNSVKWNLRVLGNDDNYEEVSNPIVVDNILFWGGHDGNLYEINITNGTLISKQSIGDSIRYDGVYYSATNQLIYPIEFSGKKNIGGLCFIDYLTRDIHYYYLDSSIISCALEGVTHKNQLVFSDSHGFVYQFDLVEGKVLSKNSIKGIVKGGFSYDKNNDIIYFGTSGGILYGYNLSKKIYTLEKQLSSYWIYSKPLIYNGILYVGTMDKKLYLISLQAQVIGYIQTGGRIFSGIDILDKRYIVFGSNDARFYIFDLQMNKTSFLQLSERITNRCVYDNDNKIIYIQDFMNNIYKAVLK